MVRIAHPTDYVIASVAWQSHAMESVIPAQAGIQLFENPGPRHAPG